METLAVVAVGVAGFVAVTAVGFVGFEAVAHWVAAVYSVGFVAVAAHLILFDL